MGRTRPLLPCTLTSQALCQDGIFLCTSLIVERNARGVYTWVYIDKGRAYTSRATQSTREAVRIAIVHLGRFPRRPRAHRHVS